MILVPTEINLDQAFIFGFRNINGFSLDPPISPAPGRLQEPNNNNNNGQPGLSSSPMSRPPTSLPHSASWLPNSGHGHGHNGVAPLSAGPEIGSHFTFSSSGQDRKK